MRIICEYVVSLRPDYIVAGAILLSALHAAFVLGAFITPALEPFHSISSYIFSVVVCGTVVVLLLLFLLIWPVVVLAVSVIGPPGRNMVRFGRALVVAMLVTLPLAGIWGASHALSYVPRVTFGILEGKPVWAMSPLFNFTGSPWALVPLAALLAVITILALFRLRTVELEPSGPTCADCGYSLIGCRHNRCPECGSAWPQGSAASK